MGDRRIMILTAVRAETLAVAKALGLSNYTHDVWSDSDGEIHLYTIGIRAKRLPALQAEQLPCCIILAGFAGALDPSLAVGDVVLDSCSAGWAIGFRGRTGKLATAEHLIATPAQKAELFAQSGALAVDMENQIVSAWAAAAGIPFVSVRAISDSADETLDPAVLRLVDEMGRVKPLALMGALIRRPALIPQLLRLGAASRLAGERLGEAVCWIVARIKEAETTAAADAGPT